MQEVPWYKAVQRYTIGAERRGGPWLNVATGFESPGLAAER